MYDGRYTDHSNNAHCVRRKGAARGPGRRQSCSAPTPLGGAVRAMCGYCGARSTLDAPLTGPEHIDDAPVAEPTAAVASTS